MERLYIKDIQFTSICSKLFLCFLLLNACYDDKGNYDLLNLNDIDIEGIEDLYTPVTGDTLEITPRLIFSKGKESDNLSFEWLLVNSSDNGGVIISDEFTLILEMVGEFGANGEYSMVFRVKDEATGISYFKSFEIRTGGNPLLAGYALLCEKPEGFDLDFVSYYGITGEQRKFSLYKNIWTEIITESGYPRIGNPLTIQATPDILAPYAGDISADRVKSSLFVSTDQLSTRVKYQDFSYLPQYELSNELAPYYSNTDYRDKYFPNGFIVEKYLAHNWSGARVYMYINGNWFFYNTHTAVNYLLYPINRTYINGEYSEEFKCSPYMYITALHGGILFNEDENKFMVQATSNNYLNLIQSTHTLKVNDISEGDNDDFSFKNPNYRLIYLGTICANNQTPEGGYAIVKNVETNKYEFLQFRISDYNGTVNKVKWVEFDFSDAPDLENAICFAYRRNCDYVYYATEDKVYSMLLDGNRVAVKNISEQVFEGSYTKLSAMDYTLPWGPSYRESLSICTYDPNGVIGENGRFTSFVEFLGNDEEAGTGNLSIYEHAYKEYDVDEDGNQILDEEGEPVLKEKIQKVTFEGIGRVIDFTYKQ